MLYFSAKTPLEIDGAGQLFVTGTRKLTQEWNVEFKGLASAAKRFRLKMIGSS